MSAKADFLDTSLILDGLDAGAPEAKQRIARQIVAKALSERSTVISCRIVQETLQVVAQEFGTTLSDVDRAALLRDVLTPLWTIQPRPALYRKALDVQRGRGLAY